MLSLEIIKIRLNAYRSFAALVLFAFAFLAIGAEARDPLLKFERTYTTQGVARLSISNVNGTIRVTSWDKKTISVRSSGDPAVTIQDDVLGDDITISVKRDLLRLRRSDFEVFVPPNTSITLKSFMGDIEVNGVAGHVSINSIDSNVRLLGLNSPSVDVKVTSGDLYFDGQLHDGGSYTLQSIKGDIDVTLPAATPFNLNARALSENINLGGFINNLTRSTRGAKGVSGSYLNGNSRLTLTAFAGRILLHKK
jgi:Putative adhesin